ncbi:glycine--tRNA ligase subunit beta [Helicobacter sp. 11S03491-1]|uniref:glycine--tRNA ligase subunit beta n=1 Tax=Helicobacter sp. 11S03491-1 TaxID=1476196 RepID=UPI0026C6C173
MDTKNLLVEILVEELPAIPFLKEFPNIARKWQESALNYDLKSNPTLFYTPRRIVVLDNFFPAKTQEKKEEFFGPPVGIGYIDGDITKGLSKAGESFCRKCQGDPKELSRVIKGDKEVLYFSKQKQGVFAQDVLGQIVLGFIESLNFGKSMRWGSLSESFIRPIRNICVFFGTQNVPIKAYGFEGKGATKVHTNVSFEWIKITSIPQYLQTLQEGFVILSQEERRKKILDEIAQIEKIKNIQVEIDGDLLDEIVSITEYPSALYGEFEERFLELPQEVIITSMKENQRYFAVRKNGMLHHGFIVISNATTSDTSKIVSGNQKVLRARLDDAMFFYHNDLKVGLDPERLREISFVEGLGSMSDKVVREKKIALYLTQKYQAILNLPLAKEMMEETLSIAKADLMSEMVYEFPELQGLMGYYYAKAEGRDMRICTAIKEQYLPNKEESLLPTELFGAIVAMANKLDSIFALFSIGKIPTGSRDPFALRRASSGVIKIILDRNIAFDLDKDLRNLYEIGGYASLDISKIRDFFIERLEGILMLNPSILRSVLGSHEYDVGAIIAKARALNNFFEKSDKEAFISTFRRVANITKDMQSVQQINTNLLRLPQELQLYQAYKEIFHKIFDNIEEKIQALFSLKKPLDDFFLNVMVNDTHKDIRENRKNLIFNIYQKFLEVGDIKEIAF